MLNPQGAIEHADTPDPLPGPLDDQEDTNSPPEPTLSRRAKSYSDLYDIVTARISRHGPKKKRKRRRCARSWEALAVPDSVTARLPREEEEGHDDALETELLRASQQEYLCVGKSPVQLPAC